MLGELASLCLANHGWAINTRQPSPWERLVAELRQAGYLSPSDDLAEMLGGQMVQDYRRAGYLPPARPGISRGQPGSDKLAQPLPDGLVMQLWRMTPAMRYWPKGGYLTATHSTSAPLSSPAAQERYGIKLLIGAQLASNKLGAPIPGQAAKRYLDAVLRRVGAPLMIALSPVLAPLWVGAAIGLARRQRTGGDLNQLLIYALCLAMPAVAVAAWYIIWAVHLPPHGPAGRWVALAVAGAFGAQNMITLYLLTISFAMDGSGQASQPVARPIRYLLRNGVAVLTVFCVVNAPLTLCVAVAGTLR